MELYDAVIFFIMIVFITSLAFSNSSYLSVKPMLEYTETLVKLQFLLFRSNSFFSYFKLQDSQKTKNNSFKVYNLGAPTTYEKNIT